MAKENNTVICAACGRSVSKRKSYADGAGGRVCRAHEGASLLAQGVSHRDQIIRDVLSTRKFMRS